MHSYILANFKTESDIFNRINQICNLDLDEKIYNNHPDIFIIRPEINEKTVTKKAIIKIDTIRSLSKKLNKNPYSLGIQVLIIFQTEVLTIAAQNSFLKLLEEPNPQTYIFLVSSNFKTLLPTIQSRCQIIIAKQDSKIEIEDKFKEEFINFNKAKPTQRLKLIEPYQKNQNLSKDLILNFIQIVRVKLRERGSNQNLAILLKNLNTTNQNIKSNLNLKLLTDTLVLNWDKKELS